MTDEPLERLLDERIAGLGFEFVDLERGGSKTRPVLRVRIDRPGSTPGHGVTLDDCASVSRALEKMLEEEASVPERYVLEVSSPGVERPLVRPRDFERFAGQEIALRSRTPLEGRGRAVQGRLLGWSDGEQGGRVRIALEDGSVLDIPHADVVRAHLVFRWGEAG